MVNVNEFMNERLRRAREDVIVADSYHVPEGHKGVNEALRWAHNEGVFVVDTSEQDEDE